MRHIACRNPCRSKPLRKKIRSSSSLRYPPFISTKMPLKKNTVILIFIINSDVLVLWPAVGLGHGHLLEVAAGVVVGVVKGGLEYFFFRKQYIFLKKERDCKVALSVCRSFSHFQGKKESDEKKRKIIDFLHACVCMLYFREKLECICKKISRFELKQPFPAFFLTWNPSTSASVSALMIFLMLGFGCISTKGSSAVSSPPTAPRKSLIWIIF